MKRCPTCQKEFADSMRFCQTDGTPLVEVAEKAPPPDPYKTVVGGSIKMDPDILEIPEQDPMKTMVSPISAPKPEPPKIDTPPSKPLSDPPKVESKPQDTPPPAPKFNEPSLSPPNFGNSSPSSSGNVSSDLSSKSDQPKFDPLPPPKSDPLPPPPPSPFGSSPFSNEQDKNDSPFSKPPSSGAGSSPFDKPISSPQQSSSPFDKTPPPPYKEPEPMFGGQQSPPQQSNQSPFGQPQSPFGQQNDPFNQPLQQNEWTPPPAPVAGWQDQGLGANTPFQPPAAGVGGENKTLPIISLVLGIVSLCCYISPLTGIAALITGFLGMKNANNDPAQYGGKTLAIVGMILGGLFFLIGIAYYIFVLIVGFSGFIPR
jgi:hypothetical protein